MDTVPTLGSSQQLNNNTGRGVISVFISHFWRVLTRGQCQQVEQTSDGSNFETPPEEIEQINSGPIFLYDWLWQLSIRLINRDAKEMSWKQNE